MKELVIKISPDGQKVEGDAAGFSGKECDRYLQPLKELGGEFKHYKKPEYNKASNSTKVNA